MSSFVGTSVPPSQSLAPTTQPAEMFAEQWCMSTKPMPRVSCRGQNGVDYTNGVSPQYGRSCRFVAGIGPSMDAKTATDSPVEGPMTCLTCDDRHELT